MLDLGGRPTSYTDEVLALAQDYLELCKAGEAGLPSIVDLCLHIGINKATIYRWKKDEEKSTFCDILDKVEMMQESSLIKNGLSGDYNSTIAKMMMTRHGYSDKLEQEISGHNGGAIKHDHSVTFVGVNADSN
jgi:hypothetical protein